MHQPTRLRDCITARSMRLIPDLRWIAFEAKIRTGIRNKLLLHPPLNPQPIMQLPPVLCPAQNKQEVISYWRLGPQITGGRWYDIYRASPKNCSVDSEHGYVLKMLNNDLPAEKLQLAIDRLGREALATERIIQANVVRLLDAELDRAPFFLVQPWIDGRSFDRFLSAAHQMSLSRLLWAARQIAAGIRAGHEKGRVHLGLDPSHVILGRTGRVTLLGWSQSHAISEAAWLPHDQLQLARYTAPECFETGYRASTASDTYSLGVLIYQALSMTIPFNGRSIDEIARAHRHRIAEDLMFLQPSCPRSVSRLVKQMMAKNPSHRPAFREVLNQLITIEIDHLNDPTMIAL